MVITSCTNVIKDKNNSSSNLQTTTCLDSEEPECTSAVDCTERLMINNTSALEVFRNQSFTQVHCSVIHAVIVIHGRDRNPNDYFSYIMDAASASGHTNDTLVISPYFREQTDSRNDSDLYWDRTAGSASQYDWAMGGQSYAPTAVSAYAVIDKIIYTIGSSNAFPNLKSIVVVGHSAGGQLVQRYALSGNYNNQGLSESVTYVSANPSSYAYLNEQRPLTGSTTSFAIPDSTSCTSYNNWGYGLENPNSYVGIVSSSQLITQYLSRTVTYLLGDADILTDGMDITCYANYQGANRFERGVAYFNFINYFFPENIHTKLIVPGVGHSGASMINSTQGISVIFPN